MRTLVIVVIVAIVVVFIVMMVRNGGNDELAAEYGGGPRSVVVLDAEGSAANIIHVYEPKDGAPVRLNELHDVQFRWSSVAGVERYLFVVNNEVGQPVWRAMVPDTVFSITSKVEASLTPGVRLKWIVQAPQHSASSDIHRIEIVE